MTLDPRSELRDVKGIDDAQKELIRVFMQGAIYCWVKNRRGEPFAVRDLVGGENTDWNGTPLQVLFEKHINMGKDSDASFKAAAKDIGWIVKSLLADDNRTFLAGKAGLVNSYDWVRDGL
jgi:hypothetical protein